ncbi:MAG: hypothetical protein AB7I50_05605 [Vicinamibacterales bacterium]
MTTRETCIGLGVLVFVLAGLIWSRGGEEATARSSASSLPDLSSSDGTVLARGIPLEVSVSRPATPMVPFRIRVRTDARSSPPLENGRISFVMAMPMGDHRYDLSPEPDGWQQADVTLPTCLSGERRWYATLDGTVDGRAITARFVLDLATR